MAATSQPGKAWVLLAVSLGQFLIQLDLTIVNVALPAIGRDLGTSVSGLQWVVDGYNLALASLLLVGGRIGDRSGHKRVYLAGVLVFALGSALCAAAPTAGALVAFRVLQGVGAAIELPATLAILTHTFTGARERAQAVGIWASAAGSSLVIGPVLGGGLVAAFGWRAVFLVNLPVTVAIGVLVSRTVRETPKPRAAGSTCPGSCSARRRSDCSPRVPSKAASTGSPPRCRSGCSPAARPAWPPSSGSSAGRRTRCCRLASSAAPPTRPPMPRAW